jgi:hypothetical protein
LKVKKFRIRPRLPTAARILKSILSVKQLSPEIEESLVKESQDFGKNILPVAFYHTWAREEVPAPFKETLKSAGLDKAIAVSALASTVGSMVEEYLSELLMNGESVRSQIVTALAEDAADLSFQFLFKLLVDDAKNDDCEIAEPLPLPNDDLLTETLALLEADQEGIHLDQASHLTPRFTRVALAAWLPLAKKKRPTLQPKKKSA